MSDDLQLIEKIKSYNSYVDENIIKNAYKYASEAHKSQKRHSGDPYISHPLAVANILAELKLDGPTFAIFSPDILICFGGIGCLQVL